MNLLSSVLLFFCSSVLLFSCLFSSAFLLFHFFRRLWYREKKGKKAVNLQILLFDSLFHHPSFLPFLSSFARCSSTMRLMIHPNEDAVAGYVAQYIQQRILDFNPTAERPFVLGLPTGGSPLAAYKKLIEIHQAGHLSFQHVVTFNMDEYVGLEKEHQQSYHYYMWHNFFKHIDIRPENVNILDGTTGNVETECRRYEEKIVAVGGIELFLGGEQLRSSSLFVIH